MGYGRLEYVSALLITALITYTGIRAIVASVRDIIHPEAPPQYTTLIIMILVVSLLLKGGYGILMRRMGQRLKSVAMVMTGTDSLMDALVSAAILAAIAVLRVFHFNLEPYLCILISLLLVYSGVCMFRECMNKILGQRIDPAFRRRIKQELITEDGVLNVCNLVVHSYGEDVFIGSVDVEVEEDMKASEVTRLSRRLIRKAAEQGLTLTSVGICGSNLSDPKATEIWDTILDRIREYDDILKAQLFTVDFDEQVISFQVVQDYSKKTRDTSLDCLRSDLEARFPGMSIEIYKGIDL